MARPAGALKCAAAAVRFMGRNEDEAALRDAVLLVPKGGDPGPAGHVFLAFRSLGAGRLDFSSAGMATLAGQLSVKWDERLEAAGLLLDEWRTLAARRPLLLPPSSPHPALPAPMPSRWPSPWPMRCWPGG